MHFRSANWRQPRPSLEGMALPVRVSFRDAPSDSLCSGLSSRLLGLYHMLTFLAELPRMAHWTESSTVLPPNALARRSGLRARKSSDACSLDEEP